MGKSAWPWLETTYQSIEVRNWIVAVEFAIFLSEPRGFGREGFVLSQPEIAALGEGRFGFEQRDRGQCGFNTDLAESCFKLFGVFGVSDVGCRLMEDRAAVECRSHVNDRNTGSSVPCEDRPLDGCRPAMSGQQGTMQINSSESGSCQRGFRQDLSVVAHDHQIRMQGSQPLDGGRIVDRNGVDDRQIMVARPLPDGTHRRILFP